MARTHPAAHAHHAERHATVKAPNNLGELFAEFQKIREDIAFARALRQLTVATINGDVRFQLGRNADNVLLDLRSLGANAATPPTGLPSQTGNAGQILTTDGATASWTPYYKGASLFTEVNRTANQGVASATTTYISFDTAVTNDHGVWSAGNPTRLTVPAGQAGIWQAFAWTFWTSAGGQVGQRQSGFRQNGTTFLFPDTRTPINGGCSVTLNFLRRLNAGDYIEVYGYQDSGGNLDIISQSTVFMRVGD